MDGTIELYSCVVKAKNLLCQNFFMCAAPNYIRSYYIVLLASANLTDFVELFCRIVSPQVPQVVSGGRKTVSTPKFSSKKVNFFYLPRWRKLRSNPLKKKQANHFFVSPKTAVIRGERNKHPDRFPIQPPTKTKLKYLHRFLCRPRTPLYTITLFS